MGTPIVKYLNHKDKTSTIIRNNEREFAKQPNFKQIKFAVQKKGHTKIEEQNKFSITDLIMETKLHTVFIFKNKLLTTMFIYYWCRL